MACRSRPSHGAAQPQPARRLSQRGPGARERFWQYFNPGEISAALRLRERLAEDAVAYFQPILSLRERKLIGVEAPARLRDGSRLLPPSEFLALLGLRGRCELSLIMLAQGQALLQKLDAAGQAATRRVHRRRARFGRAGGTGPASRGGNGHLADGRDARKKFLTRLPVRAIVRIFGFSYLFVVSIF